MNLIQYLVALFDIDRVPLGLCSEENHRGYGIAILEGASRYPFHRVGDNYLFDRPFIREHVEAYYPHTVPVWRILGNGEGSRIVIKVFEGLNV